MRIVVDHLTRMKAGQVCVAGIDLATRQHVRPTAGEPLTPARLAPEGGPFDIGAIVDLGNTQLIGAPPRVEDHRFDWWLAWRVRYVEPERFWRMIRCVTRPSLRSIFGEALGTRGRGHAAVEPGRGCASLGCLAPPAPPRLHVLERRGRPPQVRASLHEGGMELDLPVTDLRLYRDDAPIEGLLSDVDLRLSAGVEAILAVGLTWPFAPAGSSQELCWLQINNIHLRDDPGWRLT